MGGWVYIMTNGPHGTLYIGVTSDLAKRVWQHREGTGSEFCRKHGLTRLVYAEPYDRIYDAIVREKASGRRSLASFAATIPTGTICLSI
jgi:putative endonuclease